MLTAYPTKPFIPRTIHWLDNAGQKDGKDRQCINHTLEKGTKRSENFATQITQKIIHIYTNLWKTTAHFIISTSIRI